MFQIGTVQWLQNFSSPEIIWLMDGVTRLGYTPVYVVLILFLGFAVRLRPTLGVLLGLVLAGIMTDALKVSLAFPRPDHVVQLQTRLPDRAAAFDSPGFWSLPSAETRAAVRATPGISYGFPSGHVSAAMAFCLGIAVFFRKRLFLVFSFIWAPLMGLSRMYLGRHFLAGVLGGLVVGVVGTFLAALLLRRLDRPGESIRQRWPIPLFCGGALILAVLSVFIPSLDPENVGRLAVLIGSYAALTVRGFPEDAGTWRVRTGRFMSALLIFLVIGHFVAWGLDLSGWEELRVAVLIGAAISLGVSLLGSIAVGCRMGWYRTA